jgi:hypothetical protein
VACRISAVGEWRMLKIGDDLIGPIVEKMEKKSNLKK